MPMALPCVTEGQCVNLTRKGIGCHGYQLAKEGCHKELMVRGEGVRLRRRRRRNDQAAQTGTRQSRSQVLTPPLCHKRQLAGNHRQFLTSINKKNQNKTGWWEQNKETRWFLGKWGQGGKLGYDVKWRGRVWRFRNSQSTCSQQTLSEGRVSGSVMSALVIEAPWYFVILRFFDLLDSPH
jgi:hypothetical protein